MTRFKWICGTIALTLPLASAAHAQVPEGYPSNYGTIVKNAKLEGAVVLAAAIDRNAAAPLIADFAMLYPEIAVTLLDFSSTNLHAHFLEQVTAGAGTDDIILSSAVDTQIALVAQGHALSYASPEIPYLLSWTMWRLQAYSLAYEPVTFVYNKRLVPETDVPYDHRALLDLLRRKSADYQGKIAAYDPERSAVGYLLATQDAQMWPGVWELFDAFGQAHIKLYTGASDMVDRIASGEHIIAYGVFGSYALTRSRADPNLGVILPKDYTLVASRVMFIPKTARHPNAAKLFLDYLLSQRGQNVLARQPLLFSLHRKVSVVGTGVNYSALLGDRVRPIPVNASLLADLDPGKHRDFIARWQAAMRGR